MIHLPRLDDHGRLRLFCVLGEPRADICPRCCLSYYTIRTNMITRSIAAKSALVACNVYVSAGGKPHHTAILVRLLEQAQEQCRRDTCAGVVVVHAYTDTVYNRSSFHLAGKAERVATVASTLVGRALQALSQQPGEDEETTSTSCVAAHPYVGLVDHVAVMPLQPPDDEPISHDDPNNENSNENSYFQPTTPSGRAARSIGRSMEGIVKVFYYGTAHPNGTPLAIVRREKTAFFQSGGLDGSQDQQQQPSVFDPVATVGAPTTFAENYNYLLQCDQKVAQSLTRRVRERNGGLPGVEALTLPYSEGRWEVATNLLQPDLAGVWELQQVVEQWQAEQTTSRVIEKGYRVGTTAEQCLQALSMLDDSKEACQRHDAAVVERLKRYLANRQNDN
jgi:glutamate formiminotransferase